MYADFSVSKILVELRRENLLPAILFRTARKQCDEDVERLGEGRGFSLGAADQEQLRSDVEAVIEKYALESDAIYKHPQFGALVTTGVGAHHAGQLLTWRLLLEELMSRGRLRLMIATGTVAAGVDFPARSVMVTAHSKRGAEGFNVLSSSEFQQMSGRAGRRGKDTVGFCFIAPGPYSDARVIAEVAKRPPEPLRSAYFAAPATVLNLLKYRNVEDLRYTVQKSLASFLDRKGANVLRDENRETEAELARGGLNVTQRQKLEKRLRRKLREADLLEARQIKILESSLEGLRKLGHLADEGLTEKGVWSAELCTSLVLELAEAIENHLFDELVLEEFVGLIASIAGDHYREYLSIRKNPIRKELFTKLEQHIGTVAKWYSGSPFASEVAVQPDAATTVLSWIEAESWVEYASLLRLGGVAEGDAARLISQTADHLNQISHLVESHPDLARLAVEGRRLLLRPPVTDGYEGLAE